MLAYPLYHRDISVGIRMIFPFLTSSNRPRVTGNYTRVSDHQDKALAYFHVNAPDYIL